MILKKYDTWVFDLDNTLYSAETGIFDQVDKLMGEFISRHLKLEISEAKKIQKKFFRHYGTTLKGLMDEYKIDPEEFLDEVHKLDYSIIKPNQNLKEGLIRLNGKKIIYTNANKQHANEVIKRLNIENIFDLIFDIKDANYIPKPDMGPYKMLVKSNNIDPKKTIMFDDIARNLVPASKIGFTTVWIDVGKENYSDDIKSSKKYLDYETTDLPLWLNSIIKEE
ncbi:MAG: hypothetical protein CFH22_01439 [Alphaproteobacteria bacterium MarineAlpha5_Bin12]|nr:MAG: hypothetical protein CFH22_01439 [Alphaproteobacteria bacterium MarineAlpha5_Bin12]|tara:strand:- start:5892 stop:6560 length:669 start_codon:yes stop_codon:yes gene_type:complete